MNELQLYLLYMGFIYFIIFSIWLKKQILIQNMSQKN